MFKYVCAMVMGFSVMGVVWAAETAPAPGPAATGKAALPECCKDKCKTMVNCCTTDGAGKVTCAMGGGCCNK